MEIATRRRLKEELNIEASLECIYKFSYQAHFGEFGSENELCSVYLGRTTQDFSANKDEITYAKYVSRQVLQSELRITPEVFTPWFKMEWKQLCSEFTDKLNAYTLGD
jgi:isopentenyl-diphosphate delta-isomerase